LDIETWIGGEVLVDKSGFARPHQPYHVDENHGYKFITRKYLKIEI
jgi:hypothetical protein